MVNAEICLFSKVLVQFAGIVLIRDESRMDVTTKADKEELGPECEVQESHKEKPKSLTVTTEEAAAEDNGRFK